jgi:mitochondrial-processing peptidase subunit beta
VLLQPLAWHMQSHRLNVAVWWHGSQVNGIPEEVCMDHLHATAFQHTPLGRTILGPAQNIKSISRDDIEAYIRSHYTAGAHAVLALWCSWQSHTCAAMRPQHAPPRPARAVRAAVVAQEYSCDGSRACAGRMVLAAAGDVDHDALVAVAKNTFSALPADTTSARDLVAADPSHFTGSHVAVRDPDEPTTALAIAFQGAPWLSPDSVTLQVRLFLCGYSARPARARPCSGSASAP